MKYQKLLILLFIPLFSSACTSNHPAQNYFAHLLSDGYKVESLQLQKPMVLGFVGGQRGATCVYGVPANGRVKDRINRFYSLITGEFNELSMPVYVHSVEQCPLQTRIFVYLHESFEHPSEALYLEETKLRKFLGNHQAATVTKRQGLASITRIKGGKTGVVFVKINQLSWLVNNALQKNTYANLVDAIVVEELFQAITNGNDIQKSNHRMSILHEPARQQIPLPHPPDHSKKSLENPKYLSFFNNMLGAKPRGLCSYDLWFLILADKAKQEGLMFYDQYLNYYKTNSEAINKQAAMIESKLEYKPLFDARCSGENRGFDSKVGF